MERRVFFLCYLVVLVVAVQINFSIAQIGQPKFVPLVPPYALSKLKRAYAALKQGEPEKAHDLASEVFQKYGDIQVAWYPSWLVRQVKGKLPDPYSPTRDLGKVKIQNAQVPLANLRHATSAVRILFEANWQMVRFDEIVRWGRMLMQAGERSEEVLRRVEYAEIQLRQGWVYRVVPKPVRANWRALPLRFRIEDFFVLVPLDEASRVLDFNVKVLTNSKFPTGKAIFLSFNVEPSGAWVLSPAYPFAHRVEESRQRVEAIAYAPFEEDRKVWVPFYWLAAKSGLRGWELRGKRIYASYR